MDRSATEVRLEIRAGAYNAGRTGFPDPGFPDPCKPRSTRENKANEMDDFLGYIRVSTEEQAIEGFSLENQAMKIRAYCELYGLNVARIIQDAGVSAKSLKRPGWQEVESLLSDNQVKGVVIYKLDRLTRNLGDWSYLIKTYFHDRAKNAKQLHSYSEKIDTSTATGRMFLNLVVMISEWEREIIAERTRDGLGVKRIRGEKLGGRMPFGKVLSEDGITLADEPGQQEAIAEMRRLQSEGLTLRRLQRCSSGWG